MVQCQYCKNFRRNQKNPLGLGTCTIRGKTHPDRGMWPGEKHQCPYFENPDREDGGEG